jgi:peptidoglycan/xylan/chitin deacetylase (PgdA/CDA1 family)
MRSGELIFLMYHELERPGRPICQAEPGYLRYVLPEAKFRDQMHWLRANGLTGMSVGEALGHTAEHGVAITFDDGCETDLISAAPVLSDAGYSATFYVTVSFLGQPGYLSPSQMRELSTLGFEIGCHSMTHPYLTDLDGSSLHREIVEAKERIEQMLGKAIEHFSCPGGRYDNQTIQMARAAGYRSMANSRMSANSRSTDPFTLGRFAILRDTNEASFRAICLGEGLWKARVRNSVQRSAQAVLGNSLYERVRTLMLRSN